MSRWELTNELRSIVKPIVEGYINYLENQDEYMPDKEINLSDAGINPVQLHDLLEELGYEATALDTNGWECDYWWYMIHPEKDNNAKELCIYGTAMIHEIKLGVL